MTFVRILSAIQVGRPTLALLVALACFSLPLHFHAATAAGSHISNECSCLHGTRLESGTAKAAFHWALPIYVKLAKFFESQLVSQAVPSFRPSRAPPTR
jgi:hypothetical protein